MTKVAIIGASGYTGLELIRLVSNHPDLKLNYITSERQAGKNIRQCFPHLSPSIDLVYQPLDMKQALDTADLFFLALPNGLSLQITPSLIEAGKIVIDLSADYRFKDLDLYQKVYGKNHVNTEVARKAAYGLPELYRSMIRSAPLIANPGCYATSIILGIMPVVRAGLINNGFPIIADAKSGISGAGRKTEVTYLFTECDQNVKPYNIARHRHTPEIEQELNQGLGCGSNLSVVFTPQLVPLRRGILSNIYIPLRQDAPSIEDIRAIYHEFYQNEPFTLVFPLDVIPCIKDVYLSNYCRLGLAIDQRTNTLIVVSTIDNLLKGAAGQALQNANIILGLDERTGLNQPVPYP